MSTDKHRFFWPILLVFFALATLPATTFAQQNPEQTPPSSLDQRARTTEIEVDQKEPHADENHQRTITAQSERSDRPHWLAIVGRNALWGGLTGGLIGLGAWLVTNRAWSPWTIAQFTGGGILVGAVVGGMELIVRGGDYAAKPNSLLWMERQMPKTYQLPLIKLDF